MHATVFAELGQEYIIEREGEYPTTIGYSVTALETRL